MHREILRSLLTLKPLEVLPCACGRRAQESKATDMRPWKAVLGLGAACAACCAVAVLGGTAVLTAGTTALTAAGSALLACADEFLPLAGLLLVLAAAGGVLIWRRRGARQQPAGCGGGCDAKRA